MDGSSDSGGSQGSREFDKKADLQIQGRAREWPLQDVAAQSDISKMVTEVRRRGHELARCRFAIAITSKPCRRANRRAWSGLAEAEGREARSANGTKNLNSAQQLFHLTHHLGARTALHLHHPALLPRRRPPKLSTTSTTRSSSLTLALNNFTSLPDDTASSTSTASWSLAFRRSPTSTGHQRRLSSLDRPAPSTV